MSMMSEFKDFASKGSLVDMAVGIIIGAAIGKMVGALVDSILMPIIGVVLGGVDFSLLSIAVGDAQIGYGAFIQALIDFLIIAFVIFLIIKALNNMKKASDADDSPDEVALLTEIRDLLKDTRQ